MGAAPAALFFALAPGARRKVVMILSLLLLAQTPPPAGPAVAPVAPGAEAPGARALPGDVRDYFLGSWFGQERITFVRQSETQFGVRYETSRDGTSWGGGDEQLFTRVESVSRS